MLAKATDISLQNLRVNMNIQSYNTTFQYYPLFMLQYTNCACSKIDYVSVSLVQYRFYTKQQCHKPERRYGYSDFTYISQKNFLSCVILVNKKDVYVLQKCLSICRHF